MDLDNPYVLGHLTMLIVGPEETIAWSEITRIKHVNETTYWLWFRNSPPEEFMYRPDGVMQFHHLNHLMAESKMAESLLVAGSFGGGGGGDGDEDDGDGLN